ncbi:MAG: hypothetical protein HYZ28_16860 [Myxococcales bacterium]|nr:hypothetical protein [Myxococcales bacterium]
MIVCPVCEHQQQQGLECEACGKVFSRAKVPSLPVEPVAGLEQNLLADPRAQVASQPLGELERNAVLSGPDLPVVRVAELEHHAERKAGEVAVEQVDGLDRAREPAEERSAPPPADGPVTCRYCRNVQAEGAMCDRCGMRLPRAAALPAPAPGVEEVTRCRKCGSPALADQRCPECGQPVPMPEA